MPGRASVGSGRLVRVSLRDVPLRQRERAARALLDVAARAGDLRAAVLVRRAVLAPSDERYLVSEAAAVRELGAVPNGQPRATAVVEVDGVPITVADGWSR